MKNWEKNRSLLYTHFQSEADGPEVVYPHLISFQDWELDENVQPWEDVGTTPDGEEYPMLYAAFMDGSHRWVKHSY